MIFRNLNRLEHLDDLIQNKRTGNALELAEKLGISKRHVYNYIELLKNSGLKIKYNRELQTYYYEEKYALNFKIEFNDIKNDQVIKIY